eukprot:c5954_g1_i1.p1 GENE.c5954_g1_i1~~c5954_g1_i1.p1  ORF type:complete len:264 (-),score=86.18 c5954_g1_i1:29-736(-)
MYGNGGILQPLVTIVKDSNSSHNLLSISLECLSILTKQSKSLIPKVENALISHLPEFISSSISEIRKSAASLSLSLFAGGNKVWDDFVQYQGLKSISSLFRLADEEEILFGLKMIQYLAHSELYMGMVRHSLTMEPIVFYSHSPHKEISETAKDILKKSKFNSVWGKISTVDPYQRIAFGKANEMISKSFPELEVKQQQQINTNVIKETRLEDDKDVKYPFLKTYPHEQEVTSTN